MCSSTAANAPTDSITSHSSVTCASESWVPIDVRKSLAANGSDFSAHSMASASSTVRFPERRSSPVGLPVTAGSPNTPSTSSRSWNAIPRSVPTSWNTAWMSGRSAAAAAPNCSGTGHGVGGGLEHVDAHGRFDGVRGTGFGHDVEVLPTEHLGADVRPDLRTRRRASSGRSAVATMSSAQTRDRSPSRIAAEVPNCSGEPRQPRLRCSAAKCMCTVGMPRRVPDASMTSSCTRAQACSSSRPANSRSTSSRTPSGPGSSATARQPQ